jgi:hypothetical protein
MYKVSAQKRFSSWWTFLVRHIVLGIFFLHFLAHLYLIHFSSSNKHFFNIFCSRLCRMCVDPHFMLVGWCYRHTHHMPSHILCYRYLVFSVHILCFFFFLFRVFLMFLVGSRVGNCRQNSRIKERSLTRIKISLLPNSILEWLWTCRSSSLDRVIQ